MAAKRFETVQALRESIKNNPLDTSGLETLLVETPWHIELMFAKTGDIRFVDMNQALANMMRILYACLNGDLSNLERNVCWAACHIIDPNEGTPTLQRPAPVPIRGLNYMVEFIQYAEVAQVDRATLLASCDAGRHYDDIEGAEGGDETGAMQQFINHLTDNAIQVTDKVALLSFWFGMSLRFQAKPADTWTRDKLNAAVKAFGGFYPTYQNIVAFPSYPAKMAERLVAGLQNQNRAFSTYFGNACQIMMYDVTDNNKSKSQAFMFVTHRHAMLYGMTMLSLFMDVHAKTEVSKHELLVGLISNKTTKSIQTLNKIIREVGPINPLTPSKLDMGCWVWAKVFVPECFLSLSIRGNAFIVATFQEILRGLNAGTYKDLEGLMITEQERRYIVATAAAFLEDHARILDDEATGEIYSKGARRVREFHEEARTEEDEDDEEYF